MPLSIGIMVDGYYTEAQLQTYIASAESSNNSSTSSYSAPKIAAKTISKTKAAAKTNVMVSFFDPELAAFLGTTPV